YRMTDIQAAVGRIQLERLPEIVARRRALAERYRELLAVPGLVLPHEPAWARSNWQSFCVRLPEGCDQRSVMQRMLDEGIATRREAPYTDAPLRARRPHAEAAQERCILRPLYPQMPQAEQEAVASALARGCAAPARRMEAELSPGGP